MRQFDVVAELRTQIRVSLFKCVTIKELNKWIQIFVIGTAYTTTIVHCKTMSLAHFILQISGRKQLCIIQCKCFACCFLMTTCQCIFKTQSKLTTDFFTDSYVEFLAILFPSCAATAITLSIMTVAEIFMLLSVCTGVCEKCPWSPHSVLCLNSDINENARDCM